MRCYPSSATESVFAETTRDNCYGYYKKSIAILSDELKRLPSDIKRRQSKIEIWSPSEFRDFEENPKYKLEVVTFDRGEVSEDILKYVKNAVNNTNSKIQKDGYKFTIFNADKKYLSVQFERVNKK